MVSRTIMIRGFTRQQIRSINEFIKQDEDNCISKDRQLQ